LADQPITRQPSERMKRLFAAILAGLLAFIVGGLVLFSLAP